MLLISHRGNLNGANPELENSERYIEVAIEAGFNVEIDVWYENGMFFLGHDEPDYQTSLDFLRKYADKLWIHCKNLDALTSLIKNTDLNCFWHQHDDYTLTSKGYIWTYPNIQVHERNIIVIQEKISKDSLPQCLGICSDYVALYK